MKQLTLYQSSEDPSSKQSIKRLIVDGRKTNFVILNINDSEKPIALKHPRCDLGLKFSNIQSLEEYLTDEYGISKVEYKELKS